MKKKVSYLSTLGVALGPLLVIYGIGSFHLQFVCLSIPFLYLIFKGKFRNIQPKFWMFYVSYFFFTTLLFSNSIYDILPLGIILFSFFSATCVLTVNFKNLIKIFRYAAILVIACLFIQIAIFYVTGLRVPFIITSLPLAYGVDLNEFMIQAQYSTRFSSLFREPAHCAQFLTFFLLIELFHDNFKYKWVLISLSVVSLLLLNSGNALIGLGFVIAIYVYPLRKHGMKRHYGFQSLIIFVLGITTLSMYFNTEEGEELLKRKDSIALNSDDSNASGRMRVTRGLLLYEEYDLINKIVGINNQDAITAYMKTSSANAFYGEHDTYYNGITEVLLKTGLVGLLFVVLGFSSLWVRNRIENNCFIMLFALYSFIASTFLSWMMLFVFTFCQLYKRQLYRKLM